MGFQKTGGDTVQIGVGINMEQFMDQLKRIEVQLQKLENKKINAKVQIDDKNVQNSIKKTEQQLDNLTNNTRTIRINFLANNLASIGNSINRLIVGPITTLTKTTLEYNREFDKYMVSLAQLTNASQEEVSEMKNYAIDLANNNGLDSRDVIQAMETGMQIGINPLEASGQALIETAANISKIYGENTKDITQVLSSAKNAYGDKYTVEELGNIIGASIDLGDLKWEHFIKYGSKIFASGAANNVDLEDSLAMVVNATKMAERQASAMQSVQSLTNDTFKLAKTANKKDGDSTKTVGTNMAGRASANGTDLAAEVMENGFESLLQNAKEWANQNNTSMSNFTNSIKAGQIMNQNKNIAEFVKVRDELAGVKKNTEFMKDKEDKLKYSVTLSMDQSMNVMRNSLPKIGEAIAPALSVIATTIKDFFKDKDKIEKLSKIAGDLAKVFVTVATSLGQLVKIILVIPTPLLSAFLTTLIAFGSVATIIAPIMQLVIAFKELSLLFTGLPSLASIAGGAMALLTNPITWVVAAIAGLVYVFANWEEIMERCSMWAENIAYGFQIVTDWARNLGNELLNLINYLGEIVGQIPLLGPLLKFNVQGVYGIADGISARSVATSNSVTFNNTYNVNREVDYSYYNKQMLNTILST